MPFDSCASASAHSGEYLVCGVVRRSVVALIKIDTRLRLVHEFHQGSAVLYVTPFVGGRATPLALESDV
jgi:hypothetical protein